MRSCNREATGVKLPSTVLRALFTYIFFFQFITAGAIMINGSVRLISIGGSLTLVSLLIYLILAWNAQLIAEKILSFRNTEEEGLLGVSENIYMHPVEENERN